MTRMINASYDHLATLASYHTPDRHAHLCSHLAMAVEGTLRCVTDAGTTEAEGVFVASDVAHTIQMDGPALIYLFDETSSLGRAVRDTYLGERRVVAAPSELVRRLRACLASGLAAADLDRALIGVLLGEGAAGSRAAEGIDPRVADALAFLHELDGIGAGVMDELASRECLSKSRLSHLFTQEMGISLHRYLAFCKMAKASEHIAGGASLTDAAIRAGFDSSSHLSATMRRMFGISLTDVMRSMAGPELSS